MGGRRGSDRNSTITTAAIKDAARGLDICDIEAVCTEIGNPAASASAYDVVSGDDDDGSVDELAPFSERAKSATLELLDGTLAIFVAISWSMMFLELLEHYLEHLDGGTKFFVTLLWRCISLLFALL